MKLKKYLALTRIGMIEALHFRLSTVILVFGNLIYLIVVYFLWNSIYASSGADVVNGMTFTDTLIYLVLASALFNFMEMYAVWEMGRNIQTGKIVLDLLKPMEYRNYLFWSFTGTLIMNFFSTFLITFIIVCIVTNGAISIGINLIYFMFSVLLSIIINYNIDFFIGSVCIFTESIWGINIMKQAVVLLFSGATIPIAFFPEPLKTIVYYLPFQAIYNSPLTLLLNKDPQLNDLAATIGVQVIWCIITTVLVKLFWNYSIKKITVNGG